MPPETSDEIRKTVHDHLTWWGLRHFTSDDAYFAWQRQTFSPENIATLHQAAERKRQAGPDADIAFYDLTAQPQLIPALYSQRYEYYQRIGALIAALIAPAETILDFGCGIGILTTYYARHHPNRSFLGLDRSGHSIDIARQWAAKLGLTNVRFECHDLDAEPFSGRYDLIIATHALLQAEQELGVPSHSWRTFDREADDAQQRAFEERTGLRPRLDRLGAMLNQTGRLTTFEKTRLLSRRIPFQRALAARGLSLAAAPVPIRYALVEEVVEDGPLYVLGRQASSVNWDESPEPDEAPPLDITALARQEGRGEEPLYENHHASAQRAWQQLPERTIAKETTREERNGRQLHAELGTSCGLVYLYVANTFDQRQLVIVEPARRTMLEAYYREIIQD